MAICKRCKKEYKVPENTIIMAKATYCDSCISKALIKSLKLSPKEWLKIEAKQVGIAPIINN